ncbi:MAG TPA: hypothetical protein VGF94_17455 [Kofleriaceae bacterium]|jgi:hypothetical protein
MKHLAFAALAACTGLSSPPAPRVSVLVQSDSGCFALATPDVPVDPVLGLVGQCAQGVAPIWLAGIDIVEVVVDYGPDVDFAASTQPPPPTVVISVDNVATDTPVDVGDAQRLGSRAYFVAKFRAPATPSPDVRVEADVAPGFSAIVPDVFSIQVPDVELLLAECTLGMTCNLFGAVGSVHATASVPGNLPQTVALALAIDGIPQAAELPPLVTQPAANDLSVGTEAIPVPAAHVGATFTISARLAGGSPATYDTTLVAPPIELALSCGAPADCNLHAGDPVGLSITAPTQIAPLQAIVDTSRDGVPQLVAVPVALVPDTDVGALGSLALTAPAAGTWQIDASVAGYQATALVVSVQ